jgi:AAA domain
VNAPKPATDAGAAPELQISDSLGLQRSLPPGTMTPALKALMEHSHQSAETLLEWSDYRNLSYKQLLERSLHIGRQFDEDLADWVEPEEEVAKEYGHAPYINGQLADGTLVCFDSEGIDIDTGVKYKLDPYYVKRFEEVKAEWKIAKLNNILLPSRYDFTGTVTVRTWDYEGLIPRGAFCLWLGARKAEKSLFALRKAMHDECGKNWLNHKNMVGAARVLYFDTENDKADVDDRYREIIDEFSLAEQALIQKNLVIRIGKEMKKVKVDFEVWNHNLFDYLKKDANDPRIVYLDCWYQLQSIKAADNEAQKKALEMFEQYFPNTTIFLLHHTGRESQESLLRKNPSWLRAIGAERWSNKSAGGNVLTKKAELIICQEKYVERDEEGIENDSFIDFQAYSRSSPGSILYSFEPVFFGEEVNGDAPEYKFRRKMVVKLSSLAAQAARKLRGKGPWANRYALAKDVGMNGGKQYRAIDELVVKGFIVHDGNDAGFSFTDDEHAVELSAENIVALKAAGSFLDELLLRPDGVPNQGVLYDFIKSRAEGDGIGMESLRKARQRKGVRSEEREGKTWWVANAVTKVKKGQ